MWGRVKTYLFLFFGLVGFSYCKDASAKNSLAYDTKAYCTKIVTYSEGKNPSLIRQCMEEEAAAKDELSKVVVDDAIMAHCLEVADTSQILKMGGSYTILKTCVDNEAETIARYQDKDKKKIVVHSKENQ